jgi:hypothetical protein
VGGGAAAFEPQILSLSFSLIFFFHTTRGGPRYAHVRALGTANIFYFEHFEICTFLFEFKFCS